MNEKKIITVAFDGFWVGFDINNNFILNILKKQYIVQIVENDKEKKSVEVLFYSIYSRHFAEYNCVRVFFTGENCVPDFNSCDYAIGFEQFEFQDRYFRYPIYLADFHDDSVRAEKRNVGVNDSFKHRKFCAMVVSNYLNADLFRDDFFWKLSEYKKVDSGGRHLNNIGIYGGIEDKIEFISNYKFSLAFENVSHKGYCTEKILQSFAAQTVPIYWGDTDINKYFNAKAFINIHDFASIDAAIDYIINIDNNDSLYMQMLQEPVIINSQYSYSIIDKEFEKWLLHIFEQDIEKRYRRSCVGYGRMYNDNQKKLMKYQMQLDKKAQKKEQFQNKFLSRIFKDRRI